MMGTGWWGRIDKRKDAILTDGFYWPERGGNKSRQNDRTIVIDEFDVDAIIETWIEIWTNMA